MECLTAELKSVYLAGQLSGRCNVLAVVVLVVVGVSKPLAAVAVVLGGAEFA